MSHPNLKIKITSKSKQKNLCSFIRRKDCKTYACNYTCIFLLFFSPVISYNLFMFTNTYNIDTLTKLSESFFSKDCNVEIKPPKRRQNVSVFNINAS